MKPSAPLAGRDISRRHAIARLGGALASVAGGGCLGSSTEPTITGGPGRIAARPSTPSNQPPIGLSELPPASGATGLLYVPRTYNASRPGPAALLLHGAGQDSDELMTPLSPLAEARGTVLIALRSDRATWDLMGGRWGADLTAIDKSLAWMFARCAVDAQRVGVIGFSDGATYALALGRANGDLFRRVVAYSPGILFEVASTRHPEFFVTHGTEDRILPVDVTRDFIVPGLRRVGYEVQYREFTGGHGATTALITESLDWFVR